jgi:predicted DNA-binding protein (MmcQ/YjbR family)
VPPYVGKSGWVGIWLDRNIDWDQLESLIRESYCLIAPKRLSARV